jgi:hypothetical protein
VSIAADFDEASEEVQKLFEGATDEGAGKDPV